ncbi:MAG: NAD(P)/FAD-dependent oxidoreductase [Oscillospiraceae bacterium]|nr:NAD(P)/FAD-dependent oxidoreductase [Oscillospiraceae bacterium]
MKQYVIIGNGVAAAGCIEGIRSTDSEGRICVVSGENHPVYCRPLISYYLEGKTDLGRMRYREEDYYEKMGCDVLYGRKAAKINGADKTVTLDDGSLLPYDSLCVAAGSSPFVPPFAGLDTVEKKFSFMTLDDALALEAAVNPDSRVLIVGAGLIGLKCAEGLKERVASITVCDLAERVLSSILDTECAAMMQKHLENNGISFLLGDSAACFSGNTAQMKSGRTVEFDVLVLAVGVRANTALVKDIGGEVNRGIVVNQRMETSVPDVYSAGDCTEGEDISFGGRRELAILPNAYMQGKCAGVNMAGGTEVFDKAIPMNSIGFFGLHAMTAGSYFGADQGGEMYEEKVEGTLKRLFVRDGVLTGFILIGCIQRAGIYTALIREKTPLEGLDFDLIKKEPILRAFSAESRRKKLGGVV